MKTHEALLFLIAAIFPMTSTAGWLGPSDYDECVLEKMKGQSKNMVRHARNYCRSKFPIKESPSTEQRLPNYLSQIKTSWWTEDKTAYLAITNPGQYRITRIYANISTKDDSRYGCKPSNHYHTDKVIFIFTPPTNISSSSISGKWRYKCMNIFDIWGILDSSHSQAKNIFDQFDKQ